MSAIIGTLFFVLILFIAVSIFIVMFNSFSGYADNVKIMNEQQIQNSETHISIPSFNFGSSSGIASPGTASSATSAAISPETEIAYSQGLWWLFYSNGVTGAGRDVYYETSPDGTTWSARLRWRV